MSREVFIFRYIPSLDSQENNDREFGTTNRLHLQLDDKSRTSRRSLSDRYPKHLLLQRPVYFMLRQLEEEQGCHTALEL
jgi:hypothetical protein